MAKRKKVRETSNRGFYIPVGLFIGLGIGMFFGRDFVGPGMFVGLGIGFLYFMNSKKSAKSNGMRTQYEFNDIPELGKNREQGSLVYLGSTLKNYHDKLERIMRLTDSIPIDRKAMILDIVFLLQKIDEYVQKDHSRYPAVKVFFQTYISSTEIIIEKYALLTDQPVKNEEAIKSIRMIDAVLLEMKAEYEEAYSKLYEKDMTELQLEITNLRTKFNEEKVGKWL